MQLALAVALSLGYRRQFRPLFVTLLVSFTAAAFRAERDAWFLVTVGLAIIAVLANRRSNTARSLGAQPSVDASKAMARLNVTVVAMCGHCRR